MYRQKDDRGLLAARQPAGLSIVELRAYYQDQRVSAPRKKTGRRNLIRRNLSFCFMCLPALILLFLFAYIPMYGVIIAFENYMAYKGIWGSDWVGFQNFHYLFASKDAAWRITFNTLSMNALFIVTGTLASIGVALLLDEVRDKSRFLAKFYQSTLFFPYLISWVLVNYFMTALLDTNTGLLNHLLVHLGLTPVNWYGTPQYWPLLLTVLSLWKGAGFGSIIYLAGIVSLNPEYFEAARIDGASRWRQVWHITLPLLKPLIIINVLLAIGKIFYADFGLFYIVTHDSSLLYSTTDVIDTFVYRALTNIGDVGMASAAGLYQAFVGFVLVLASNWVVKRTDPDKALF